MLLNRIDNPTKILFPMRLLRNENHICQTKLSWLLPTENGWMSIWQRDSRLFGIVGMNFVNLATIFQNPRLPKQSRVFRFFTNQTKGKT